MKTQLPPEHCPTCGCPCDVSGIGYSPTELYNAAPETAAERDRLKEALRRLVAYCNDGGDLYLTDIGPFESGIGQSTDFKQALEEAKKLLDNND